MRAAEPEITCRTRRLPDVDATAQLAGTLSEHVRPGDVVCLAGTLGVGKTTFARAFVNAVARKHGLPEQEVPSPTFTLVQAYEFPGLTVSHFDLYRIETPDEVYELGLDDAIADGVVLIEWPERMGGLLPTDRVQLELLAGESPEERLAELTGYGAWAERLGKLPL
jgi:tRNA threonylcarbamoyl adenosine modification protein YjeE